MLIKSADDKSKRLTLLEDLQKSNLLDIKQKKWLREELMRCRKGIQGEKESAFYLDSYFKGAKTRWLPGVNALQTHRRWAFAEFTDVYAMQADFADKVTEAFSTLLSKQTLGDNHG